MLLRFLSRTSIRTVLALIACFTAVILIAWPISPLSRRWRRLGTGKRIIQRSCRPDTQISAAIGKARMSGSESSAFAVRADGAETDRFDI